MSKYIKGESYLFPNRDYPIQITKPLPGGGALSIIETLSPTTDLILVKDVRNKKIREILFRKIEGGEKCDFYSEQLPYEVVDIWHGYSQPKKKKKKKKKKL